MELDKNLYQRKADVLAHYRSRAGESLAEIAGIYGTGQFKQRASAMNSAIYETRNRLVASLEQRGREERWANEDILRNVLMLSHCCNVVMIEFRNAVWPYEYMAFSRRIGELWERFCALCFHYSVRDDVRLFVPPLFDDVRRALAREIADYIRDLPLAEEQRTELLRYYDKVWTLVTSGQVKLELDVHVQLGSVKYVVDLKSGFSSNEKGNTNRLLLVASIYRNLEGEQYRCLLLVRQKEDENNHYLLTLKNSGLWEVSCGDDSYERIRQLTGFDLRAWVGQHIDWQNDLSPDLLAHLRSQSLTQYLRW